MFILNSMNYFSICTLQNVPVQRAKLLEIHEFSVDLADAHSFETNKSNSPEIDVNININTHLITCRFIFCMCVYSFRFSIEQASSLTSIGCLDSFVCFL